MIWREWFREGFEATPILSLFVNLAFNGSQITAVAT